MGTLYLVGTPIGNLEDMSFRAVRILQEVSLVAAEDTRSARKLLGHYGITARLTSYNEHNARAKTPSILQALDEGDVAVVTDAGMPGISDPGHDLVVAAIAAGHDVVPIPGPSAVVAAVAASGLPSRRFHYLGFLPRQSGPRRRALAEARACGDTLVVYESPHRLIAMLEDAREALGDRRIAVARELTKLYEEIWRGSITEAIAYFREPRGEFTVVIEGGEPPHESASADEVNRGIAEMRRDGLSSKEAVAEIARRYGIGRRQAYRLWHADDASSA
jgi:16S rRNA (cytidine1402-2'-O)-methyltransferase